MHALMHFKLDLRFLNGIQSNDDDDYLCVVNVNLIYCHTVAISHLHMFPLKVNDYDYSLLMERGKIQVNGQQQQKNSYK